jgi:uncharacterized surface anchored protein
MPLPCSYILTDLSGKVVQEGLITGYNQQINITDIAGGCYLLSIDGYSVRLMRQ